MIKIAMYTTILTLHKQGNSGRKIAALTGHDRRTIQKMRDEPSRQEELLQLFKAWSHLYH